MINFPSWKCEGLRYLEHTLYCQRYLLVHQIADEEVRFVTPENAFTAVECSGGVPYPTASDALYCSWWCLALIQLLRHDNTGYVEWGLWAELAFGSGTSPVGWVPQWRKRSLYLCSGACVWYLCTIWGWPFGRTHVEIHWDGNFMELWLKLSEGLRLLYSSPALFSWLILTV